MNINFAPIDEAYIKRKVETGYYTNATELIRDAIRRMRESDAGTSELWDAVMQAEETLTSGAELASFTPTLHAQIVENAKKKAKLKAKPNPDVLP